jgi:processive 1,2-diacylglycerol beta-glucosyltransferase
MHFSHPTFHNEFLPEVMMIQLRDKEKGTVLGTITAEDLQFLIDNLEEESEDDTDYFINRSTLEIFKEKGTNQTLIKLLEDALGDHDDMEIEWFKSS